MKLHAVRQVADLVSRARQPEEIYKAAVATGHGTPVVVAPQQTFLLSNHEAVIVPRPFLFPQRGVFISAGVAAPSGFVAFRTFHHHFGHVIVFVNLSTLVVWPTGFWWWSEAQWTWAAQTIAW